MSDIVQRLRDRVHDSHMDNERLMDESADELERLRRALKWEQHYAERQGTHGPGCADCGPAHCGCLIVERDRLRAEQLEDRAASVIWHGLAERLEAERDQLRGRIDAHNADCIARCENMRKQPNPGQGGICEHYTNRGRTCPNCPRDEMIEE